MKIHILLAILFIATNSSAQTVGDESPMNPFVKHLPGIFADTTLNVSYVSRLPHRPSPAIYLNGKLVNLSFFSGMNLKLIDSLDVRRVTLKIGDRTYYGRIQIKTKNSYQPRIISLTELKEKYTNLKDLPAVFVVDGELITEDHREYVLDENTLWRIVIDKTEYGNVNVNFIKVLSKSEENLKKQPGIRIRGTELGLSD